MSLKLSTRLLAPALTAFALLAVATLAIDGGAARAARPQGDLFYNYYYPGSLVGGPPVSMYPSPLPVPARVGHTYITYQPLYPHEFMYPHSRTYRRYARPYGVVPVNTTRVVWW